MDTTAKLIIAALLGTLYAPAATAYDWPAQYDNLQVIDGDLHVKRPGGGTSHIWPDIKLNKDVPVNTSKGNFLVPFEKNLPVVPDKVGKAATRFLKLLPPVASAIALYDIVCDLSTICLDSETGELMIDADPYTILQQGTPMNCNAVSGYQSYLEPLQTPGLYHKYIYGPSPSNGGTNYGSQGYLVYLYCNNMADIIWGPKLVGEPTKNTRPLVETDWAEAETKLNAQPEQTATALYNSDAPVPVTTGTQLAPITKTVTSSTTQIKDEHGNTVGTQVQTTNITVTDTSTTNNISFNITETTITENYDDQNQLIGSTETQSSNEPPKSPPTEPTTIEFDNLPPDQLQEESVSLDPPDPGTWGEGVCPGDVDLGIYGLTISYQPACDAAAMLRPIFITLSSITALLIMAGVSIRGGE